VFEKSNYSSVKWVRYMVPTLPFIYLGIALFLSDFTRKKVFLSYVLFFICCVSAVIFSVSYFVTAFVEPDTRMTASDFAKTHISRDAVILSEVYDLGITAFNSSFPDITLFNFYNFYNTKHYNICHLVEVQFLTGHEFLEQKFGI